ncbi:hypothetical protein BDV12DRAFT_75899 [Aspergillus spectabilis]
MELLRFNLRFQRLHGGAPSGPRPYSPTFCLLLLVLIAISASVGAVIGRRTLDCRGYSNRKSIIPLYTHKEAFVYNRTFGEDPQVDENTVIAWDSIVPVGQGSVRHPSGSETASVYTLSVVHQLHCLWSIHQNYYNALHPEKNTEPDGLAGKQHMRHCFDYLRQSLMCASDSTLEPVDAELGGVTGWGNERVCRDYAVLRAWAEERRVSNERGFSSGHDDHA